MDNLSVTLEAFATRPPLPIVENSSMGNDQIPEATGVKPYDRELVELTLKVDPELAYRVFDEFPRNAVAKQEDGSYLVHAQMQPNGWLYGYLMSYEDHLEVLAPAEIRDEMINKIKNLNKSYKI
jgi:predicted DNA-binding transcriptional regulator YafY